MGSEPETAVTRHESEATTGNRPAFMRAPRCLARNRRGQPCQAPAMRGRKRCRLHGGKATGAKTAEGRERIRQAHLVHGMYTPEMIALRREARQLSRAIREMIAKSAVVD